MFQTTSALGCYFVVKNLFRVSIFRSETQFSEWFVILFQIEFVVFMFFPVIASIVTNSRVDVNRGESICLLASLR